MESSRNQFTIFTQIPKTAESHQKSINPYLMSILNFNVFFTGSDSDYSVKDYLKGNLNSNKGREPISTPFHQIGFIDVEH